MQIKLSKILKETVNDKQRIGNNTYYSFEPSNYDAKSEVEQRFNNMPTKYSYDKDLYKRYIAWCRTKYFNDYMLFELNEEEKRIFGSEKNIFRILSDKLTNIVKINFKTGFINFLSDNGNFERGIKYEKFITWDKNLSEYISNISRH